jgi:hypothetical protein
MTCHIFSPYQHALWSLFSLWDAMTSSFVDPTTVRPNFGRQSSSVANQHTSFTDDSVCCGNQESHCQHYHQNNSQSSQDDSSVQFQWFTHDPQYKRESILLTGIIDYPLTRAAWSITSNNTWYPQLSPGAYGLGHTSSGWDSSMSQTYMSPTASTGHYIPPIQPTTNNWLLQRSYHGIPDATSHQLPWTYNQMHSDYDGPYRQEYQPYAQGRVSYGSSADVHCSDTSDGRLAHPSVHANYYTFASPDEAPTYESYHPEKHDVGVWDWSQAMSHSVPPSHIDIAIQDPAHSPNYNGTSHFSKLGGSIVTPGAQTSPTSSCWDIDDNASLATTNTTTLTELIPEPSTELVDPPPEDMNTKDKTMVPQRRNLKDPNHLYMPRWIRGDGKQREGWCGACRPGKWLSLKRSTYWCR